MAFRRECICTVRSEICCSIWPFLQANFCTCTCAGGILNRNQKGLNGEAGARQLCVGAQAFFVGAVAGVNKLDVGM